MIGALDDMENLTNLGESFVVTLHMLWTLIIMVLESPVNTIKILVSLLIYHFQKWCAQVLTRKMCKICECSLVSCLNHVLPVHFIVFCCSFRNKVDFSLYE